MFVYVEVGGRDGSVAMFSDAESVQEVYDIVVMFTKPEFQVTAREASEEDVKKYREMYPNHHITPISDYL
jgi:hypothetical protein